MELKNLLVWFLLDDDGQITQISRLMAIDSKFDLDKYLTSWSAKSEHRQANVYTFTREQIDVPEHIMAGPVSTTGVIMHYHGKRHMAIMPYFVTIGELE
jgi:hypothetical protein